MKLLWGVNVVLLVTVAFLLFASFNQQEKIAYIDTARLFDEYKGMQFARGEYREKTKIWQANVDTLVNQVQIQIGNYEKNSPKMSEGEKEQSLRLIRTRQQQLEGFQKSVQEKAAKAEMEMTHKVYAAINAYIQEYGESHNYKIIMATTETGNILYGNKNVNITDDVLNGLNGKNEAE